MRMIIAAATATTALLGAGGAQALPGFANGGFEQPGGEVREFLTPDLIPGWTASPGASGALDIYESDDQGDGLTAAEGTHYVSFGHDGTYGGSVSETFAVTPGTTIDLTYQVAEQQGDDPTQVLQATITDTVDLQSASASNTALPDTFMAGTPLSIYDSSGEVTVTFFDATPAGDCGGSNLALDQVEINGSLGVAGVAGVPEPAGWALMIVGVGGIGTSLRGRRRRVALTA
jgi:hypothetical protein